MPDNLIKSHPQRLGLFSKNTSLNFGTQKGFAAPPPYKTFDEKEEPFECEQFELIRDLDSEYQSWDFTFTGEDTSDYVCGQVWGLQGSNRILKDQFLKQVDFTDTIKAMKKISEAHPRAYTKIMEKKANADAIHSTLKGTVSGMELFSPHTSKIERAIAVQPFFRGGDVYLPHPHYFPWVEGLIKELCAFPRANNDDQVDSTTQFLNYIKNIAGIGNFHAALDAVSSSKTLSSEVEY